MNTEITPDSIIKLGLGFWEIQGWSWIDSDLIHPEVKVQLQPTQITGTPAAIE